MPLIISPFAGDMERIRILAFGVAFKSKSQYLSNPAMITQ